MPTLHCSRRQIRLWSGLFNLMLVVAIFIARYVVGIAFPARPRKMAFTYNAFRETMRKVSFLDISNRA